MNRDTLIALIVGGIGCFVLGGAVMFEILSAVDRQAEYVETRR